MRARARARVCVKNDRLWYVCVCVCVWMTEATVAAGRGEAAVRRRRGGGAEGMGRAGPWNKSIPNGRETDGDADGRTGKKAAWQPSAIPSAPADIVLRARCPAYVFFFVVFNSDSRFIP